MKMIIGSFAVLLVVLMASPRVSAQTGGLNRCFHLIGTPAFSQCIRNILDFSTTTRSPSNIFRCQGLTGTAFFDCLANRETTTTRRGRPTTAAPSTLFPCQGLTGPRLLDCLFPDSRTRGPARVTSPTTTTARITTAAPRPIIPTLSVIQRLHSDLASRIAGDSQLIPAWVQLGFHSCVGGCDGCIDLTLPDNRGLATRYNDLKALHSESYAGEISLADMLAQSAVQAAETGMDSQDNTIPIRYGRRDCPNLDGRGKGAGRFPDAKDPAAIRTLEREFDLTNKEAIALLGAHSLGRCRRENLGFEGPWDFSELKLESGYYLSMSRTNWQLTETIKGEFQWNSTRNDRMMLTADLALWKDIPIERANNRPQCNPSNSCPNASQSSRASVTEYADNTAAFHRDFAIAFVKMLEKTDSRLVTVTN